MKWISKQLGFTTRPTLNFHFSPTVWVLGSPMGKKTLAAASWELKLSKSAEFEFPRFFQEAGQQLGTSSFHMYIYKIYIKSHLKICFEKTQLEFVYFQNPPPIFRISETVKQFKFRDCCQIFCSLLFFLKDFTGVIMLPTQTKQYYMGNPSNLPYICTVWSPPNR